VIHRSKLFFVYMTSRFDARRDGETTRCQKMKLVECRAPAARSPPPPHESSAGRGGRGVGPGGRGGRPHEQRLFEPRGDELSPPSLAGGTQVPKTLPYSPWPDDQVMGRSSARGRESMRP